MLTVEISMMHHQGLTDLTPKSYTALGLMNIGPSAITVSEKSPYQNMNDLLTAIKANPEKLKASGTGDRKSTRLNSSHYCASRMPSSDGKKKIQLSPLLLLILQSDVDID